MHTFLCETEAVKQENDHSKSPKLQAHNFYLTYNSKL